MATKKTKPKKAPAASVDAFLDRCDDATRTTIAALRRAVLAADASIDEGIKWNAPSFRTTEWFATMNLGPGAAKDRGSAAPEAQTVRLVLHAGAKASPDLRAAVADPNALLTWLDHDRAIVTFADTADVDAKRRALTAVLRQWLTHLPPARRA
jgi:uncharacterized protein YdhG (YjbR/CyaY superfamily)